MKSNHPGKRSVLKKTVYYDMMEDLTQTSVLLHNINAIANRMFGISIVQWHVLSKIINYPGRSAGGLAQISKLHPSTLTPTLTRLEAMEYIFVCNHPQDKRRKMIVSSRRGFEVQQAVEFHLFNLANMVGDKEVDCLKKSVNFLRAFLQEMDNYTTERAT